MSPSKLDAAADCMRSEFPVTALPTSASPHVAMHTNFVEELPAVIW
jgi:hypothetical protein